MLRAVAALLAARAAGASRAAAAGRRPTQQTAPRRRAAGSSTKTRTTPKLLPFSGLLHTHTHTHARPKGAVGVGEERGAPVIRRFVRPSAEDDARLGCLRRHTVRTDAERPLVEVTVRS